MKETRAIMGMPITVEIVASPVGLWPRDTETAQETLDAVFAYFTSVDERFSTYKDTSEISRINQALREKPSLEFDVSPEMLEIFELAEKTKQETHGFFDIKKPDGTLDPSGIVKGWAIKNAADMLVQKGFKNFYIEAGGDIQACGKNSDGAEWSVGVRNPFNRSEIIKVIFPRGKGVATSGSYERGGHIYNPHSPTDALQDIVSITVVGPNVLEADRFATAAFAMGADGVNFIENLDGFEAYSIDEHGIATMTSGFTVLIQ